MVRICDGKTLPKGDRNAVYMLRTFGGEAHEIWNVADPANPVLITRLGGLKDTHKSWWECETGIAFLVSGAPDWRTRRMTQVYDLSDPAHPVKIRDFGLPGQEPGSTGAVPTELHGPISTGPEGNRVYFGYGTDKGGFLQIVERRKIVLLAEIVQAAHDVGRYVNIHVLCALDQQLLIDQVAQDILLVFFDRALITRVGGWDEQNLTEDADIGLRLSAAGERIRVAHPIIPRAIIMRMISLVPSRI